MNKDAPEILVVLLDTVKAAFIILFQETQDRFLKLTAALAGDDLDGLGTLLDRFIHNAVQGAVQRVTIGENTVQIKF